MVRAQHAPVYCHATLKSNVGSAHPSMTIASFLKSLLIVKPPTIATPLAPLTNVFFADEKDSVPPRALGNGARISSATDRHFTSLVFSGTKSSEAYANLSISTPLTSTASVCDAGTSAFMPMD
jgi:hypothetical protein